MSRGLWRRRIEVLDNGCWRWRGHRDRDGYARATIGKRNGLAHRLVFEQFHGPVPAGVTFDHVCHSSDPTCVAGPACPHRGCVNPAHLEPVSHQENVRRSHRYLGLQVSLGSATAHCRRGHKYDEANTYVTPGGHRVCRACQRATVAAYRERKATQR